MGFAAARFFAQLRLNLQRRTGLMEGDVFFIGGKGAIWYDSTDTTPKCLQF